MASEFKLEPALETKLKRLRLRPELPRSGHFGSQARPRKPSLF
jgi:hypothetical protein